MHATLWQCTKVVVTVSFFLLKSLRVSNVVESSQELVQPRVSGIIKETGLYLAKRVSDRITFSSFYICLFTVFFFFR